VAKYSIKIAFCSLRALIYLICHLTYLAYRDPVNCWEKNLGAFSEFVEYGQNLTQIKNFEVSILQSLLDSVEW
jgi:hypothetical protein